MAVTRSSVQSWATCCWPAASATCTPRSRPSTWTTANQLLQAGSVDEETVEGMRREFRLVQNDPNAVFFYSFVQGRATVY